MCEGIIKVHAPLHSKASTAIQLDGRTTAKDVTAHFACDDRYTHAHTHAQRGHVRLPEVNLSLSLCSGARRLFEVGGNIGERRLHPDCLLLDVYHANPACRWLVKP